MLLFIVINDDFFKGTKLFVTDLTGHFFDKKFCDSQPSQTSKFPRVHFLYHWEWISWNHWKVLWLSIVRNAKKTKGTKFFVTGPYWGFFVFVLLLLCMVIKVKKTRGTKFFWWFLGNFVPFCNFFKKFVFLIFFHRYIDFVY